MSSDYTLARGAHPDPSHGRCAMEWVSHLAGEPHNDAPACVSPVVRVFCTALNDALDDSARQRMRRYLPRTIGTARDGLDEARSWMAMDWLVRVFAPTWLAAVHLRRSAAALAALAPIADVAALKDAIRALERARAESRNAWSASLGAARGIAWAPRAAGRGTAREAAWSPVGRPTWAAAAVEIRRRACDRASGICREIAGDAAAALIRNQRGAGGRVAAADLQRMALSPTLERVQRSAFTLLDRMLPTLAMAAPDQVGQRTHPIVAPHIEHTTLARPDSAPSNR